MGTWDIVLPRASTCCTAGLAFANAGPLNSPLTLGPEDVEGKYCAKNAKSATELDEDGGGSAFELFWTRDGGFGSKREDGRERAGGWILR